MKFKHLIAGIACSYLLSGCIQATMNYYQFLNAFSEKYSYEVQIQRERITAYEINKILLQTKGKDESLSTAEVKKKLEEITDDTCTKKTLSQHLNEPYFPRLLHEEPEIVNDIAINCMIDILLAQQVKYPK